MAKLEDRIPPESEFPLSPDKTTGAPESAPRFKAGDAVQRRVGGQEVVIKRTLPLPPDALRAHIEDDAPPPPFEYECYWFEGTQYKAGVVFEFELLGSGDF